ncbi:MAG: SRPBCC domain-containing protein [Planctomycetaceae bacterium]
MTTFQTSRLIPAAVGSIFAAISDPARLARWWGPAGFTNSFEVCEFTPCGQWVFTMHGPDGKDYANINRFVAIDAPRRVVIEHVCEPQFTLTIELTEDGEATRVNWTQAVVDSHFAENVRHIIEPANEQNLDRLTAEVLGCAG